MEDLGVRPTSVDLLVTLPEADIASRRTILEVQLANYNTKCEELKTVLAAAETTRQCLQQEYDNVLLVQQLQSGEIVRVICPACKGSGLKPTDVTSGQLHRKSAFEGVGETVNPMRPREVDPKDRCPACEGKRYQLMERYRG
jgi:Zn finger protein HypA/HybF involved in hydrogenase expression